MLRSRVSLPCVWWAVLRRSVDGVCHREIRGTPITHSFSFIHLLAQRLAHLIASRPTTSCLVLRTNFIQAYMQPVFDPLGCGLSDTDQFISELLKKKRILRSLGFFPKFSYESMCKIVVTYQYFFYLKITLVRSAGCLLHQAQKTEIHGARAKQAKQERRGAEGRTFALILNHHSPKNQNRNEEPQEAFGCNVVLLEEGRPPQGASPRRRR